MAACTIQMGVVTYPGSVMWNKSNNSTGLTVLNTSLLHQIIISQY